MSGPPAFAGPPPFTGPPPFGPPWMWQTTEGGSGSFGPPASISLRPPSETHTSSSSVSTTSAAAAAAVTDASSRSTSLAASPSTSTLSYTLSTSIIPAPNFASLTSKTAAPVLPAQTNGQSIAAASSPTQAGMSPGLQAAAGASVSLGVILLSLLGFLALRYRRRRRAAQGVVELEDGTNNDKDNTSEKSVNINTQPRRLTLRHELPASPISPFDMPASPVSAEAAVSDVSSCYSPRQLSSPDLPELPEDNFSPSEVPADSTKDREQEMNENAAEGRHIAEQMRRPEYRPGDDGAAPQRIARLHAS